MATPFRADQVGSLLRPPEVLAAREAHEQGDSSLEQLRQVEDRAVLQALEMLRSVGIEIFSDGELRRGSFLTGPADALQGFRPSDESFLREWHGPGGGMLATTVRIVATRLEARRFTDYEIAFLKQHSPGPFKITMPTPSMLGFGGFREGITDQFYADSQELHQDLARIIRAEIQAAIDDGAAYIQLDAPNYPMRFCDQRLRQQFVEQGIDVESELTEALAADQACVQGIDRKGAILAFHVCRGNNQSRWQADGGYEPIAEKMFSLLDVDRYLLEYDTDRAGGFEPLRFMPRGKAVVLGLVTTKEAPLESQDSLMQRLEEASRYVDMDDLALSPQCGFASVAQGNLISSDDQKRKLELVVETARRAWG
jgi:5-methyltetrahydropteroyltriglutamate--homocysteine methyltransferase